MSPGNSVVMASSRHGRATALRSMQEPSIARRLCAIAPDAVELSDELSGYSSGIVAIDRRVSVDEGFLEIRVPIAQDRPLTNDLTVDAGYRYSVYSTAGAANTYKVDVQFAPIADVRLRASFDRVVRAPNLIELYTPLTYGASGPIAARSDPCAPTRRSGARGSEPHAVHAYGSHRCSVW